MKLQITEWSFSLFPPLIFSRTEIKEELMLGLAAVLIILALYPLLSAGCAKLLSTRRRKVHRMLTGICAAVLVGAAFLMARYANNIPFAPAYLLYAHLLLLPFLLILQVGTWFILRKESCMPPAFSDSLRVGLWFNLLMLLPILLPLLLVQVPIVHAEQQLIYIGPIVVSAFLFLGLSSWFRKHSFSALGLEMQTNELIPSLAQKFLESSAGIEQNGDCTIHILRPGFRNALAFYPDNRILVGLDLIEYLKPGELRAILLHELGHLKDDRYIKWIRWLTFCFPVFFLLFEVLNQSDIFQSFTLPLFCLLVGICTVLIILQKVKLRAEFQADAYVRAYEPDLQQHLLSAVEAIYELNGVEKDFCSKSNYSHLDPAERKTMLDQGEFKLQRKVFRPFIRNFLISIVLGLGIGLLYALGPRYLWPSDVEKWRRLHNSYHDQKYSDHEAARKAIEKALKLSEEEFGELHNRTYISLNDLTELHLLTGDLKAADTTSSRNVEVGEQLYPEDLRKVRSMRNRADTLGQLNRWAEAESLYLRALAFQEQLADTASNRAETLYDLARLYTQKNAFDKAISCYRQIVHLHQASEEEDRSGELQWIYMFLARELEKFGDREGAVQTFNEGLLYFKNNFGVRHPDTIQLVCSQAEFLQSIARLEDARKSFVICLEGHQDSDEVDLEEVVFNQLTLAEVCLALGDAQEALLYAQQVRKHQEELYGPRASGLAYTLRLIAGIYEAMGDMNNARKYEEFANRLPVKE